MTCELLITHNGKTMIPPVLDGLSIEWQRCGQAGKLSFEVLADAAVFEEGDACRFSADGVPMFFGFIFEQSRTGSNAGRVKVTAYDQLFYLRNKDYFQYENKTATEVVRLLAEDFGLQTGVLTDTRYRIPSRTEDNKSLFDIIQTALDETMKATGRLYVLYDAAGRLTLSYIGDMMLGLIVDRDTAGDYEYKTSISDTYNKIRLFREGETPVTVRDAAAISKWGVLQYVEKVSDEDVNLREMANALLSLYGRVARTLTVKNVLGDIRVRAGTLLLVILQLGDIKISNYMLVEQVKHTFKNNEHLMELKVRGNEFVT